MSNFWGAVQMPGLSVYKAAIFLLKKSLNLASKSHDKVRK